MKILESYKYFFDDSIGFIGSGYIGAKEPMPDRSSTEKVIAVFALVILSAATALVFLGVQLYRHFYLNRDVKVEVVHKNLGGTGVTENEDKKPSLVDQLIAKKGKHLEEDQKNRLNAAIENLENKQDEEAIEKLIDRIRPKSNTRYCEEMYHVLHQSKLIKNCEHLPEIQARNFECAMRDLQKSYEATYGKEKTGFKIIAPNQELFNQRSLSNDDKECVVKALYSFGTHSRRRSETWQVQMAQVQFKAYIMFVMQLDSKDVIINEVIQLLENAKQNKYDALLWMRENFTDIIAGSNQAEKMVIESFSQHFK